MTEENANETQVVEVVPEKKPLARIDIGPKGLMIKTHDELYRFAGMVLKSDLCPKDCKSAEDAFVRMQYGLEIGLSPMQSLQRIANVNGRPCVWGDAIPGLIWASGNCEYIKETFSGTPYEDDFTACCEMKRKDSTFQVMQEFSVEDAKMAKLWGKSGPWTQQPRRMLQMRARGFAGRDAFPDALQGLYLAEEMQDVSTVEVSEAMDVPSRDLDDLVEKIETPEAVVAELVEDEPEPEQDEPASTDDDECRALRMKIETLLTSTGLDAAFNFDELCSQVAMSSDIEIMDKNQLRELVRLIEAIPE